MPLLLLLAVLQDKPLPKVEILERTAAPMMVSEAPWEDMCLSWCTVLRVGKQWHLWYESFDQKYKLDSDGYLCYARSKDGVKWERPRLGLVEYGGNRDNNILISGPAQGGIAGSNVFIDEQADPSERFKIVFIRHVNGQWPVFGGTSPDGIHWKLHEKPLYGKNSDTQIACFRDGSLYRLYVRTWSSGLYQGTRLVGYSESPTFGNFADAANILKPDAQDPKDLHFYNSAASKLRDDLYVLFPSGFTTGDDVSRVHFAVSRNGKDFERPVRGPVLDLGKGFDSQGLYVGPGAVPGDKPGTWWFYYVGTRVKHGDNVPGKAKKDGGYGRFLLKVTEN